MNEILTKEMRGKIPRNNIEKNIETVSDLVLIHKTDYIPTRGIIQSSKDAGVLGEQNFFIGEQEYNVSYPSERESVHFAVNGEVESHSMGDFDNRKYAIIIPFNLMDKSKLVGGSPVDTYTQGSVEIPKGSYILCPSSEVEQLNNLTKNLTVVGYEGISVDGYANYFISQVLGYKKERIGDWSWENAKEDCMTFSEIYDELGLSQGSHSRSKENDVADAKMSIHRICEIIKIIKNNDIIKNKSSYIDALYALKKPLTAGSMLNGNRPVDTIFSDLSLTQQLYTELEEVGIVIPMEMRELFEQQKANAERKDLNEDERTGFSGNKIFRQRCYNTIVDTITQSILNPYKENCILNQTFGELDDEDKEFLKLRLEEMTILTENGYKISIPTIRTKFLDDKIQDEECLESTSPIITYNHDNDQELLENINQNATFFSVINEGGIIRTNFSAIQTDESIGQYITRIKNSINLLERLVNGEQIKFNEDGTQQIQINTSVFGKQVLEEISDTPFTDETEQEMESQELELQQQSNLEQDNISEI